MKEKFQIMLWVTKSDTWSDSRNKHNVYLYKILYKAKPFLHGIYESDAGSGNTDIYEAMHKLIGQTHPECTRRDIEYHRPKILYDKENYTLADMERKCDEWNEKPWMPAN